MQLQQPQRSYIQRFSEFMTSEADHNGCMEPQRSYIQRFSEFMTSEADHNGCMEPQLRLFGMDLTLRYPNFSHAEPVQGLGGDIRANKEGDKMVPKLEKNPGSNFVLSNAEGSASKNSSSAQGTEGHIFPCRYCSKKFYSSKSLGGHQNAHKKERAANKSNPRLNTLSTNCFQYPALGQKPAHAISASNCILSQNIELVSIPLSCLKRARNDTELGSGALPSVKRPRNEDLLQRNTVPGRMVTLTARGEELDLSLHL